MWFFICLCVVNHLLKKPNGKKGGFISEASTWTFTFCVSVNTKSSPYSPHSAGFGKMVIQVQVHGPKKEIKNIDLCETEEQLKKMTVKQFKEKTAKHFLIDCVVQFVYTNKRLQENELLVSYGIKHMSVIQMVLKLPGGIWWRTSQPGVSTKPRRDQNIGVQNQFACKQNIKAICSLLLYLLFENDL